MNDNIITVTALNRYVRSLLESDAVLTDIRLRGEIANYICNARSGHCYFSLRDGNCSVKAVMFRGDAQQLNFDPQNGMQVVADCRVTLYERDGAFQVCVSHMFPDGLGAVRMAFEKLKARLETEGLFEESHKCALPALPATVGVITSATGAALQDIKNVLSRRLPMVTLLLSPVTVQGEGAAAEIAGAITQMDQSGLADVIIVARGGGSAEDLWVFNSELIARAAYLCGTPLISAIGHETDFTILDFVADKRAPTPSAAAELAVPSRQELAGELAYYAEKCSALAGQKVEDCRETFEELRRGFSAEEMLRPIGEKRRQLEDFAQQLQQRQSQLLQHKRLRLQNGIALADSLSPYRVLARGYSLVLSGGRPVSRLDELEPGETVEVTNTTGGAKCLVQETLRKGWKP